MDLGQGHLLEGLSAPQEEALLAQVSGGMHTLRFIQHTHTGRQQKGRQATERGSLSALCAWSLWEIIAILNSVRSCVGGLRMLIHSAQHNTSTGSRRNATAAQRCMLTRVM